MGSINDRNQVDEIVILMVHVEWDSGARSLHATYQW
jgi:hypothetical protein